MAWAVIGCNILIAAFFGHAASERHGEEISRRTCEVLCDTANAEPLELAAGYHSERAPSGGRNYTSFDLAFPMRKPTNNNDSVVFAVVRLRAGRWATPGRCAPGVRRIRTPPGLDNTLMLHCSRNGVYREL